ncbi:ALF repeat-containing protein [Streptomyces sp. NPDC058375]|uniref:ALF repeat-containing protein n=1 Tax=Streptomyces sp. NPDC058375 TaxID=3346467 RepID=UPI0036472D3D
MQLVEDSCLLPPLQSAPARLPRAEAQLQPGRSCHSWRQDVAAQALAGTDEDVLDYLSTGWQSGVADEIRQQVADLSTTSPYDTVRVAAVEALTGTSQQIRDFYTTGQYVAAESEYRAEITTIYNTGGTSTQGAAGSPGGRQRHGPAYLPR